jgi:hypothetical protein
MVFQGGLAIGSAAWGAVAERAGTKAALVAAAVSLVFSTLLTRRFSITSAERLDLSPVAPSGLIRSAPVVVIELAPEEGPVRISLDYEIDAKDKDAFVDAMHALRAIRLRDGAMRWSLYRDSADARHFSETFLFESWAEYLRHRERMTMSDVATRKKAFSFHKGEGEPVIARMVYIETKK